MPDWTTRQRVVFADVQHCYKYARRWYRARTSGERVTLASLWRAGALDRRPHRGREGEPNAAYEYAPRDAHARYPSVTITPEMLNASKKEP